MDTYGKIAIIGAGPAGLLTSFFIRRHDVIIFEEHTSPGKPEHCTGIIGSYTASIFTKLLGNKIIDNQYYGVIFHTPYRDVRLQNNKPIAYHVRRPLLEEKLAELNQSIGHKIFFGVKVRPDTKLGSLRAGQRSLHFQKIVASDGTYSFLRKTFFGPIKNKIYGIQAIIETSINDPRTFHIIYTDVLPDFFAWFVPINDEKALIGYGVREHVYNPFRIIRFLAKRIAIKYYRVKKFFGGTIPLDLPLEKPVYKGKIFFIGDSIPLTKPYTGGGLYGITLLAQPLAKVLEGIITLREYLNIYRGIRRKFIIQHKFVNIIKKHCYWLPVFFLEDLYRLRMFKDYQFDEHERIAYRSLIILPYTIPKLMFCHLFTNVC